MQPRRAADLKLCQKFPCLPACTLSHRVKQVVYYQAERKRCKSLGTSRHTATSNLEKVMLFFFFFKVVLCHWATGWNTLNRKSVVALAVRPHFGIFVSVCRGEKKKERERAQGGEIKKERECELVVVKAWACHWMYQMRRAAASHDYINSLSVALPQKPL